jgi:hypothetical protein
MNAIHMNPSKEGKEQESSFYLPDVRRRRVRASSAVLMAQEGAAQVKNDVYSALRGAHEQRGPLPSVKAMREQMKVAPAGIAVGRAKQVQYAIDDAFAMFRSFRSNFFAWTKDPASRPGKPRPPRFYRRGQRARLRFDYQEFKIEDNRLHLPASIGLGPLALVERGGEPLLNPGDRLVEVRVEPCRSRQWAHLDLVIRRAESAKKDGSRRATSGSISESRTWPPAWMTGTLWPS